MTSEGISSSSPWKFIGRTDSSKLCENLHSNAMHQPCPPLGNREHDPPTRNGDCLLGSYRRFDLMVLPLNVFLIRAIEMEFAEHFQRFVFPIRLHEMPGRFREEHDPQSQNRARQDLKCEWQTPLNTTVNRGSSRAIAHPLHILVWTSDRRFKNRRAGSSRARARQKKRH
jgi:hypothetical protein